VGGRHSHDPPTDPEPHVQLMPAPCLMPLPGWLCPPAWDFMQHPIRRDG
jgi:hypothetical protein